MSNEEEGYEPTFVTLVSNEGDTYDVEVAVATQSEVLKDLLTNLPDADDDIPLANVNTRTLIKVIEWCTHYRDVPAADEKDLDTEPVKRTDDMNTWDKAFLDVDPTMLYELVSAANYLNIEVSLPFLLLRSGSHQFLSFSCVGSMTLLSYLDSLLE